MTRNQCDCDCDYNLTWGKNPEQLVSEASDIVHDKFIKEGT